MLKRRQQGQVSMEYILLVGLLLVILIPLFYYSLHKSSESISRSQAEDAVKSLAQAADEVYSLSPGTKKFVWVSIPGGVQGAQINGSEITLAVNIFDVTSDVNARSKAVVVGSIPLEKGTYRIPVELLDSGGVQIGAGNDTTPPQIMWKAPNGLTCNPVSLRANTNEPAICKFDVADTTYNSMSTSMKGNSLGHSYEWGVQEEGNYRYFVRCSDSFGNNMNNSALINYTINLTFCGTLAAPTPNETNPPNVTLLDPAAGYVSNSPQLNFFYNVTDESPILLCKLIVNTTSNSVIASITNPPVNTKNNITGNLDLGFYLWSVNCTDSHGSEGNSSKRLIRINATLDSDQPTINLMAPANGSVRKNNLVKFSYNVTDVTSGIHSCTLQVYGKLDNGETASAGALKFSVPEMSQQNFTLTLDQGNYTWNISCDDDSIYRNLNISETRWLRVNTSSETVVITSCAGQCWFENYQNGICRQEPPKCNQNNEVYLASGDKYCTGGAQSDTCCCMP